MMPSQTLCYCFGHTTESIRGEVRRTGQSTVVAAIVAKIKADACDCVNQHPEGRCCLGDVRRAVKETLATAGVTAAGTTADRPGTDDCCAPAAQDTHTRAGRE